MFSNMRNDQEVGKFEADDSIDHKCLSPVLSGNTSRKALFGRKGNGKSNKSKTGTKLCEQFQEESQRLPNTPFTADTFSLNTGNSVEILNELERIEQNRQYFYEILTKDQSNISYFKKPLLPVSAKCEITNKNNFASEFNIVKSELEISSLNKSVTLEKSQGLLQSQQKSALIGNIPNICDGFQTAFGRNVMPSQISLKKHSKIFDDILMPIQSSCDDWENKFTTRKDKEKMLPEDTAIIGDIAFQSFFFKQPSLNNKIDQLEEPDDVLSMTQEISRSGISDAQMVTAVDEVLNQIKTEEHISPEKSLSEDLAFLGFTSAEIEDSKKIFQMKSITLDKKLDTSKSGQIFHSASACTFSSPPSKRIKIDSEYQDIENSCKQSSKTENVNYFDKAVGNTLGFSTAAGGLVTISAASLEKHSIFDDFESNLPSSKQNINSNNSIGKNLISNSRILTREKLNLFDDMVENNLLNLPEENKVMPKNSVNVSDINRIEAEHISIRNNSNFAQNLVETKKLKNLSECLNNDFLNTPKSDKASNVVTDKFENSKNIYGLVNFNTPISKDASVTDSRTANKKKLEFFDQYLDKFDECSTNKEFNFSNSFKTVKPCNIKGMVNVTNVRHKNVPPRASFNSNAKVLTELQDEKTNLNVNINNVPRFLLNSNSPGFSSASGRFIKVSEDTAKKAHGLFEGIDDLESLQICKESAIKKHQHEIKNTSYSTPVRPDKSNLSINHNKRKLGMSSCKQISITVEKLKKARLIFDENIDISPIKSLPTSAAHQYDHFSTPVKNDFSGASAINFHKFATVTSTPVQKEVFNSINCENHRLQNHSLCTDLSVVLDSPTKGNCTKWIKDLEAERHRIEELLKILKERENILTRVLDEESNINRKPKSGILYLRKKAKPRISLPDFVQNKNPWSDEINDKLNFILPQNAENLHFKEHSVFVRSKEDALVIPNFKNLIGLSEIEYAFKNMPGVESSLLLKDWVRNHYKWIIWKLASYERMFPKYFEGTMTVENIIQQLKYRYDREIDKSERSALRRIYEKDDVSQKRMVLCVADINEVSTNKYELQLTDGWYSIRTIIDEPLCNQVLSKRIKIGTKIITYGAELLYCDGCHPLETTNLTCLKINFNSTRRAIWYAKLGYQKFSEPFPIPIHSVHPLGGLIGAVKIIIIRSYPIHYMEKHGEQTIWRNKKAEERRAQKWDNERSKKIEKIREDVMKKCNSSDRPVKRVSRSVVKNIDVSTVSCPKELFEILEICSDPDSIEQKLTPSQKRSLLEYKSTRLMKIQEEVTAKIKVEVEKLKMIRRYVKATQQLLVTDIDDNTNRPFKFIVWQPNEAHVQMLKEGTSFAVYNILPQRNGDLCTGNKTVFKLLVQKNEINDSLKRKLIPIEDLAELQFIYSFREFDTIGIVVNMKIEESFQEIWLTNISGSLLHIRVYEGPSTCLLLEGMKRGQVTSVCNLLFKTSSNNIAQATANHFSIFSCYSQYQHLQQGLETFNKELPKNLNELLNDCDNKIALYKMKNLESKTSCSATLEESDEETLHFSRLTSTDVALSLLDLDQFR